MGAEPIEKVSIIVSKGSFDGIYPPLIMANGARMEGIEANIFFTFFGLDAINKARNEHVKVASVGNPGLHLATWVGGVPGMSAMVTTSSASAWRSSTSPRSRSSSSFCTTPERGSTRARRRSTCSS